VMYLLSFIFLIFGIVGTQLFMGKFHNQCYERVEYTATYTAFPTFLEGTASPTTLLNSTSVVASSTINSTVNSTEELTVNYVVSTSRQWELVGSDNEFLAGHLCSNITKDTHNCASDEFCTPINPETGALNQNPFGNYVAFDHLGLSFLTILTCISLEGWVDVMYFTFDAAGIRSVIYFLALVIFGALFVINLVVAVIYEAYMSERESKIEEEENEEAMVAVIQQEATTLKTRLKSKHEMKKTLGGRVNSPVFVFLGTIDGDYWNARNRRDPINLDEAPDDRLRKFGWRVYWFFEQVYLLTRDMAYTITKNKWFQNLIILMIALNTILLAMEYHGMSDQYRLALEKGNEIITWLFMVEMLLKFMGFGIRNYVKDNWNNFDGLLACVSFLELEIVLGAGAPVSALRPLRILRVFRTFRLARRWKSLRKLIVTIARSGQDVLNFMFLVLLFVLIYALCGMELYGTLFADKKYDKPRANFESLYFGLISVFQVMTGENWNEALYEFMMASREEWNSEGGAVVAAVFFVSMFVVGHYIWLNLFLAILLDNFQKDQGDGDNTFFDELEANNDGKVVVEGIKGCFSCIFAVPFFCVVYSIRYACIKMANFCCRKQIGDADSNNMDESFKLSPGKALHQHFPKPLQSKLEKLRSARSINRMIPAKASSDNIFSSTQQVTGGYGDSQRSWSDEDEMKAAPPGSPKTRRPSLSHRVGCGNVTFNTAQPRQKNLHRVDTWEQEDEFSRMRVAQVDLKHLILQMREEVPIGNHRRSFKFFVNCFPAAAVVDYLLDNDVVESLLEAIMVGQRLVEESLIAPASVKDKEDNWRFEDNSELLRFLRTPPTVVSLVNRKGKVDERTIRQTRRKLKDRQMKMADGHSFFCIESHSKQRRYAIRVATSPWFDNIVVSLILFSTVLLALDQPGLEEGSSLKSFLTLSDYVTTTLFTVESAIKVFAMGFVISPNSYLRSGWNVMDFFIVLISWITLATTATSLTFLKSIRTLRTLRTLRALRPLRMISRSDGMKMVVNAILHAMPSVINVVFILILFFFIFAVVGLNLFSGKFYYCDGNGETDLYTLDKEDCYGEWYDDETGASGNRTWMNLASNYDNIGYAFITTFELASLEMWPIIMWHAIDSNGVVDKHPVRNNNVVMSLYFISFIVCGSFFVTNLFVGVVINKFLEIKKKSGTSLFLTQQQVKWVRVQKQILSTRPLKMTRPPITFRKLREPFYQMVRHGDAFEIVVMAAIILNVLVLGLEHHGQGQDWDTFFANAEITFTAIFVTEMVIKMLGLGLYQYFRNHWNKFDFSIVVLSIVELAALQEMSVNFTFFRVLRTARIVRLIKRNKGLKDLFQTLIYSLPSLVNVGSLLILLIFVYGVMGMNMFNKYEGGVTHDGVWITDYNNFDSFAWSVLVLFRCATGESWNGIMHEIGNQMGTKVQSFVFFLTYMILCNFLLLNLFIAVILENFAEIVNQKQLGDGLEASHIKQFNKAWSELDPRKTLFIPCFELVTLLYALPKPLGLKGSEELKAAEKGQLREQSIRQGHSQSLDRDLAGGCSIDEHIEFMLNHVRGLHLKRNEKGKVFYLDVLSALSKFAFDRDGENKDIDFSHLEEDQVDQLTKELVTLSNHYEGTISNISDDLPELDLTDEYNAAIGLQVIWRGKKVREETLEKLRREGRNTDVLARIYDCLVLQNQTKRRSFA